TTRWIRYVSGASAPLRIHQFKFSTAAWSSKNISIRRIFASPTSMNPSVSLCSMSLVGKDAACARRPCRGAEHERGRRYVPGSFKSPTRRWSSVEVEALGFRECPDDLIGPRGQLSVGHL